MTNNNVQHTHTLAVVSLVFGILGLAQVCPGLGSLIALITGHMARRAIQTDPRLGGDGLARAGILMGWIGLGLMLCALCAALVWFLGFMGFGGGLPPQSWLSGVWAG
jgi:hypothetical protein